MDGWSKHSRFSLPCTWWPSIRYSMTLGGRKGFILWGLISEATSHQAAALFYVKKRVSAECFTSALKVLSVQMLEEPPERSEEEAKVFMVILEFMHGFMHGDLLWFSPPFPLAVELVLPEQGHLTAARQRSILKTDVQGFLAGPSAMVSSSPSWLQGRCAKQNH